MPASGLVTQVHYQNLTDSPIGRVSLVGTIKHGQGLPANTMRVLGSFALVYLLEGGGLFQDSTGQTVNVSLGDLMTVFPEIPHRYGPTPGKTWSEVYIVFSGPVFDMWRKSGLLDPNRPVRHLEPIPYWHRRIAAIVEPADERPLSLVCRLQELLADLLTQDKAGRTDREWLARAEALLDPGDPVTPPDWEQMTQAIGVSYEAFRKRFTRLAGIAPARYHAHRVIDRACERLRNPELSTRQVASACGFCDEFHFSRRFKQLVGVTPAEFRRRVG